MSGTRTEGSGRRAGDHGWPAPDPAMIAGGSATDAAAQWHGHLDQRLAAVAAELGERFEARIAATAEELRRQRDDLVRAAADELRRENVDTLAAVVLRLDALEARCLGVTSELAELNALSGRLDDVIATLASAAAVRDEQVDAVRGTLEAAQRQLDHIAPMRERVASLSQSSAALTDEFREYQLGWAVRWEEMSGRIREVEESVGSDGMAAIEAHLDRMADLERAVGELNPDRFVKKSELRAGM